MRNAGEQRSERVQLLGLPEGLALACDLGLRRAQSGEIDLARDDRQLALEDERPRGDAGRHVAPVGAPERHVEGRDVAAGGHLVEDPVAIARIPV